MYVWDTHDILNDSMYSFNVSERVLREPFESGRSLFQDLMGLDLVKPGDYRFNSLYDFTLFPWISSSFPWDFDIFDASETDDYYEQKENAFTSRFKFRHYEILWESFQDFWKEMFHVFDFKPARHYDFTFWKLYYGITYYVEIPFFLDILYRPDIWDFLRSYYYFFMDFPWEIFTWRSSLWNHLGLNNIDFFGGYTFDGVREASFDSNLFNSFYEYSYYNDFSDLDEEDPIIFFLIVFSGFLSFFLLVCFFYSFFFFFKLFFYIVLG